MTARSFLRKICGLTARSMTVLKYAEGGITRDGELLRSCDTVRSGDVIELCLPPDENEITPVAGELDILFEDDYLLIVNKPPHMPVHPTKVHQTDTLANIVSFYQDRKGERYTFRALNRLDQDTSGCILIAKDRLSYAMTIDSIGKKYLAVCEGVINNEGVVDAPIGLAPGSKIKRCVSADGQRAVTYYQPLKSSDSHTLLELSLLTGRTHQIRCHMSSIDHPLAGDDLYGGSRCLIGRQALHCGEITFTHPLSHESIMLRAQLPQDMEVLLNECGII